MAQRQKTQLGASRLLVRPLVFPMALAIMLAGWGAATPDSVTTTARPSDTGVPIAATPTRALGGQSLRQVWLVGKTSAWAWIANLSGGAQALERTTDGGTHWTDITPQGLHRQVGDRFINGFFALDLEHAWVAYGGVAEAARQTIASTSDGGHDWTVVGHQPSGNECDLDFVTPSDAWCAVIGAERGYETVALYRTTNGGKQWRLVSRTGPTATNPPGSLPFACDKNLQFESPKLGWAVFACGGGVPPLYETTNGGKSWVSRHVTKASGALDNGSGFAGYPVLTGTDGSVGYTIGGPHPKSFVYVSTDAGASWHPVTPPGPPEGWLVDTMTPRVWRLVDGDHILATDDGGRTWRTITSNVSFRLNYPYDAPTPPVVDFATSKIGWIVSTSLWRTTDGGSTWRRVAVPGT